MKGISTIIASIIMVVITIGLISVAYLYMSGLLTGTTANNIQLMDAYCDKDVSDYNITTIVKNIGTASINSLTFYVDGKQETPVDATCYSNIAPGSTSSCNIGEISQGMRQLRVVSTSSVGGPVQCG